MAGLAVLGTEAADMRGEGQTADNELLLSCIISVRKQSHHISGIGSHHQRSSCKRVHTLIAPPPSAP